MEMRRLGGTDLDVSVLCFGPMRSAAKQPGQDPAKSQAGADALRAAIDAGINFIHSSFEYGTRWMMKDVLKDHPKRNDLIHIIKLPVPDFADEDRFDADKFRLRVEEALDDLCTDRIDVLQYMWRSKPNNDERRLPLLGEIMDDVMTSFQTLKDEGKVGYMYPFPYTVPAGQAVIDTGQFQGLIAYYNLIEMEMFGLFDELRQRDMGFISIRPLYQGILTDQRADRENLPADDRFRDAKFDDDFAKLSVVQEAFADEIGDDLTGFALRFVLADPLVASQVLGLNSVAQVESAVAAVGKPIPSKETVEKAWQLFKAQSKQE